MIARTWPELIGRIVVALLVIAILYVGIERVDPRDDAYNDQVVVAQAVLVATLLAAAGLFVVNLVFIAPYQVWKEEKDRAEAAEAALHPAAAGADRADHFKRAILELKHLATARELWWHHNHQRDPQDDQLTGRLAEAINQVRNFFPPGAPGDPKEDQITRLWDAALTFGSTLGYARSETSRLSTDREKFERELQGTIESFEQLNGERNSTSIELWRDVNPLQLYQAACLWVEKAPPDAPELPLPIEAGPWLHRLRDAVARKKLPIYGDKDGRKFQTLLLATARLVGVPMSPIVPKIPSDTEVGRSGLKAYAKTIGECPKFLFEEQR